MIPQRYDNGGSGRPSGWLLLLIAMLIGGFVMLWFW